MKNKILLALILLGAVSTVKAQGRLELKDVSQPNDIYSSFDNEGAVMIRCHQSISLTFSSTMDKSAEPYKVEQDGSDNIYFIEFPTGSRYRGRALTISARGYQPLRYDFELKPKQLITLHITDPDALVDAGCYREHRNKGVLELRNMNYQEARNQFLLASDCSDTDSTENNQNIAIVDSIIYHRQKAEEAFRLLDYLEAAKHYEEVVALNPYDTYAARRDEMSRKSFGEECETVFLQAENYFMEKEMNKALELYQRIVDKGCSKQYAATERINAIKSLLNAKKTHARVFGYEWSKDTPIGIHYGKYNMKRVGGFFMFSLNNKIFDALRNDCKYGDEKFPEMNMAFGWTVKIASPVWVHFGPGFTGKLYYGQYNEKAYPKKGYGPEEYSLLNSSKMGDDLSLKEPPVKYEDEWRHKNLAFAVSPVVGITLKYSFFAVRATYQYRWAMKKDLQDFIGKQAFSLGLGVAF